MIMADLSRVGVGAGRWLGFISLPLPLVHGHGKQESKRASYCILIVDAAGKRVAAF